MNYILIMTEGNNEKAFIQVLLDKGILKYKQEELLAEKIFHSRQIDGELMGYIQLLPYQDTVTIYRVGDKLSDSLRIPSKILPEKIKDKIDISTNPEFEMLFILNENLFDEYLKYKSKLKPSEFYKIKNKDYNKQSKFIYNYFNSLDNNAIRNLIDLYVEKHGKTHESDKKNLKELIN